LIPGVFNAKPIRERLEIPRFTGAAIVRKRTDAETRFRNDWDGLSGQRVVLVGFVAYALVRHAR
jgi:hypothetical protein